MFYLKLSDSEKMPTIKVIVTGELKSGGQHCSHNDFWASKIENIVEEDVVVEEAEAVRLANVKDIELQMDNSFEN